MEHLVVLGYVIAVAVYLGVLSLFFQIVGIILAWGKTDDPRLLFSAVIISFVCILAIGVCIALAMRSGARAIPVPDWFAPTG